MVKWFRKLGKTPRAKGLELPPPPVGPPPFLGGSALGSRGRQLAAYQGWVFAAVNAIARRAAGVPLHLYLRGEQGPGPEVARHPILDLLLKPNSIMTGRQLRHTLVTHLELTGMAFALVVDNALGRPAELWPLSPADLIEIISGGDTRRAITGYKFHTGSGSTAVYAPGEVLYFRHPSPASLIYGASPIEAMAHAFDIDLAVRVYQKNFFRNAARPEVVLQTDQRLTEDEARRILTRWNQKHQGLAHVFEPTVLDGGLKVQPLAYSAKDFEFMDLAGWTQDNILAAYGVPAGKLGLVKDVNRANAQGIDVTFNSECIRPRLELIEDVLGAFLLPRYGQDLLIKHENPVPTDRAQTHKEAMQQLDRGVLTINEARASLGRPPVPWGDAPPAVLAAPTEDEDPATKSQRKADLRQCIVAAWPGLEARFAGWSRGKVAAELATRPQLMEPALGRGLGPADRDKVKYVLECSLREGRSLDETITRALACL